MEQAFTVTWQSIMVSIDAMAANSTLSADHLSKLESWIVVVSAIVSKSRSPRCVASISRSGVLDLLMNYMSASMVQLSGQQYIASMLGLLQSLSTIDSGSILLVAGSGPHTGLYTHMRNGMEGILYAEQSSKGSFDAYSSGSSLKQNAWHSIFTKVLKLQSSTFTSLPAEHQDITSLIALISSFDATFSSSLSMFVLFFFLLYFILH